LEGVLHLTPSPPDGLDVHAGDLRQEAVAAVADLHGLQGDVPAALLLIRPAEEEVHPVVEKPVRVLTALKTGGASALIDDRLRHHSGSMPRDASRPESVSEYM